MIRHTAPRAAGSMWRRGALLLTAGALAACGGDATAPAPKAASRLEIVSGDAQVGQVGTALALPLVVRVLDSTGAPIRGTTVSWSVASAGGSVAPSSSKTDRDGTARTTWTLAGSVANTDGVLATVAPAPSVSFRATRVAGLPAALTISSPPVAAFVSTPTKLTAKVTDAFANDLAGAAVAWTSSDASAAYVNESGFLFGVSTGSDVTISASISTASGVKSASVSLPVLERPLAIPAATLPEMRLTTTVTTPLVAVGGKGPYVWRVADGTLPTGITLAPSGALSGTPQQVGNYAFTLTVRDALSVEASASHAVTVCTPPVTLAAGQSVLVPFPDACGAYINGSANASYRVGVIAAASPATSGAVLVPSGLSLRATGTAVAAAATQLRDAFAQGSVDDVFGEETRRLMRSTEQVHLRLRDEEFRTYGRLPALRLGPPRAPQLARLSGPPAESRTFWVNNPAGGARIAITATLRRNGTNIIYYEDNDAIGTSEQATDAEIDAVIDFYDRWGKPVIDNAFGGMGPVGTTNTFAGAVRATDDIDDNGKFIVVQVTGAHMLSGAAAYVSSCDRLPVPGNSANGSSTCTGSNEAEITYMLRPNGQYYRGVVVHEAKHIASHGWARFGGRGFNPSWIEEGTAEIAGELASRAAMGFSDRQEMKRVEVYPGGSASNESYQISVVTSRARAFLLASPLSSLLGDPNPNPNGSTIYGASWLFHRFLADKYATQGDAAFFRTMNTARLSVAGIEATTGKTLPELLAEFTQAIAVEGNATSKAATSTRFRSYDLADIATRFTGAPWPYVEATTGFTSSTTSLATYFTSPTFFDFNAAAGQALRLDLVTSGGVSVDPAIGGSLIVVRLR